MRFEGKWVPFAEAQQLAAKNPRFAEYRKLREQLGGTIQGQATLAHWCAKNKLADEEQIHWRTVLALEPENREAIKHLGLVHCDGVWVKPAQRMILKKQGKQIKDAREHWMPICEHLQHDLDHGSDPVRQQSAARLRQIDDPAAIRSMMNVLSIASRLKGVERPSIGTNLLLVEALGNLPQQESTNALIREVLKNPVDEVALAAADELRHRSLQSYVPILLSWIQPALQANYRIHTEPDGTIVYVHRYFREEAQADEMCIKELYFRPSTPIQSLDNPLVVDIYQKALALVTSVAQRNQIEVEQRVAAAEPLNKRIQAVLERTTGHALGDEPTKWWQYWLEYNELFVPAVRPFEEQSIRINRIYAVPPPPYLVAAGKGGVAAFAPPGMVMPGGLASSPDSGFGPFSNAERWFETHPVYFSNTFALAPTTCFAAGTQVVTLAGSMPIELVQVGDRVLAQDAETGELAYKPVLQTTIRPAGPMLSLAVRAPRPQSPDAVAGLAAASETFLTTKGHPFWVNGSGWQMAKNLQPGNRLHAMTGGVEVESVEDAGTFDAYNLVVDEFHTYFIGASHVLVHDNSFAEPLLNSVPGLPPQQGTPQR